MNKRIFMVVVIALLALGLATVTLVSAHSQSMIVSTGVQNKPDVFPIPSNPIHSAAPPLFVGPSYGE